MELELHFQDGFAGETIEILVDGKLRARFEAKTRYQINLAHIEKITVDAGQELEVKSTKSGETIDVPVDSSKHYYIVSKRQEQFSVRSTDQAPGYL